jgi:hypothetical protein
METNLEVDWSIDRRKGMFRYSLYHILFYFKLIDILRKLFLGGQADFSL